MAGDQKALRPAVFLDRDGTLNVDKDYVHRFEDWEWIPGSVEALQALAERGYALAVITNQSGVARGYYTGADVEALHRRINAELETRGVRIDGFYFCPHAPDAGCVCRKPSPGMVLQAAKELGLDLTRSYFVGDKVMDVGAARAAGVRPILVLTGHGRGEKAKISGDVPSAADLLAAVDLIGKP